MIRQETELYPSRKYALIISWIYAIQEKKMQVLQCSRSLLTKLVKHSNNTVNRGPCVLMITFTVFSLLFYQIWISQEYPSVHWIHRIGGFPKPKAVPIERLHPLSHSWNWCWCVFCEPIKKGLLVDVIPFFVSCSQCQCFVIQVNLVLVFRRI